SSLPKPTTRQPWLVPIVVLIAAVTLAGGMLARGAFRQAAAASPAGNASHVTASSSATGPPPGSPIVTLSDDAAHYPLAGQVRSLLQTYVNAINNRDYSAWKSVVDRQRIAQQPRADWLAAYQSSRDGSMYVHRIEHADGTDVLVLLTFTSTQDLAHAPKNARYTCLRWHEVFLVGLEAGRWKLRSGTTGTTPQSRQC
ncbi:MAG: hypothetical protein ACRDQ1_08870, partial [Sciscionella sp.]